MIGPSNVPYKRTPIHDLVSEMELRSAQVSYWASIREQDAALWLTVYKPLHAVSDITLFWCLANLYEKIRKIQTEGTASLITATWALPQKFGLGPRWFALIEKKIRIIEDILPRCLDYLSKYRSDDFIAAAEHAYKRKLIDKATRDSYLKTSGLLGARS